MKFASSRDRPARRRLCMAALRRHRWSSSSARRGAGHTQGQGQRVLRQAGRRVDGRQVKVEVYANSTLYKDKEEMEALQLGAVQMLAPSLAKFGPLGAREFEVFDLPFIFDTSDELHKVTTGAVGAAVVRQARNQGHQGPGLLGQRLQVLLGQQAAEDAGRLQGPEDAYPVVQGARVADARRRRHPQVMAFSEVYQALQTGVVDGTENPHSNLYTQKMHEVQKHMTVTDHGYWVMR